MSSAIVNVSDLKNRLSHYLRQVRQGQSLFVRDRQQIIARIEPAGSATVASTDEASWLDDLERRGTVRRARTTLPRGWYSRRPKVAADVVKALLAERDEGR